MQKSILVIYGNWKVEIMINHRSNFNEYWFCYLHYLEVRYINLSYSILVSRQWGRCEVIAGQKWQRIWLIKVLFHHFVWRGLSKHLRFWLFCLDLIIKSQKQELNSEAELQGLVYFDKTTNYMINYWIRWYFQQRSQWSICNTHLWATRWCKIKID